MFYLVATPIGNLSDITIRAIEILKSCDYILCEDTRHSGHLLRHYSIDNPLKSFHKFNEGSKEELVINDLLSGKSIALISDAGTPGISDPGSNLVRKCVERNIIVSPIPGACAFVSALTCSGLNTEHFQFLGFSPKKTGELRKSLQQALSYPGTTIYYESPHRLLDTLKIIKELEPERRLVVARELTKKFEEFVRGTADELVTRWEGKDVLGEIVLLIEGKSLKEDQEEWLKYTPEEHVEFLMKDFHLPKNEAIKLAAEMRGVQRRFIYNLIHKK